MAFTAKKLLEVCESQNGTVGGNKYCDYFNRTDLHGQDWCCVFGCWALAQAGRNIGCWPNCGRVEAEGGVQAGMLKAGFKQCSSLAEAGPGACIIINHHNDNYYIYDHFVIWIGTYSYQNGVKGIDVWNGNASNSVKKSWYPVSHVERIWMPNFDSETVKNGWVKESGGYRYYDNGTMVKNAWKRGDGSYASNWFYLGSDGAPLKSCIKEINGSTYAFAANGVMHANCGVIYNGKLYAFGADGKLTYTYKVYKAVGVDGAYIVTK